MTQTITAPRSSFETDQINVLYAEASSLGIAPADWPRTIFVNMPARGMEPAMTIEYTFDGFEHGPDADVVAANYATRLRTEWLTIIND